MLSVTILGVLGAAVVWYLGTNLIVAACLSTAKQMSAPGQHWSKWQSLAWSAGNVVSLTAGTALARSWPLPVAAFVGVAGAWLAIPLALFFVPKITPSPVDNPPPN